MRRGSEREKRCAGLLRNTARLAVAGALLLAGGAARAGSPRLDYTLHCMGCHLASGGGTVGRVPALAGFMGRFLTVPGGREFLVRVPGTAQAMLADQRVAELLNWMLVEFSPTEVPPDFEPYTAAEVGELRSRPLTEVGERRRELVEAILATE